MSNNSNPYDLDSDEVKNKTWDNDVVRADVLDVLPDAHAVRVNPRGDNSPIVAPVLTPMYGTHALPQEGERVTLLYITENVPIVLGAIYLSDTEQPPSAAVGDYVIGNSTGSHVTVHEDGHISIITDADQRVDVDHQSASIYLANDYSAPSGGTYTKVPFDTAESDEENLFDAANNSVVAKADGLYRLTASVELPSPAQNNAYQLALFVDGVEEKRVSRQSAVNEPLSIQITTMEELEVGSEVDVRISNDSGQNRTVLGSDKTTEFDVRRAGI
jgi:hypothetical protein